MAGGDRKAYDRCKPVFATFSRGVAYLGPAGSGQVTELLNNAMTMSNLGNASLRALGRDVTSEIAPHIQGLMSKDVEHFADAIRGYGLASQPLHDRALAGASGLAEAVGLLAADAGR
jgi:hypothetical protein